MLHRLLFFLILISFILHPAYMAASTQIPSSEGTLQDTAPKVFIDCDYCDGTTSGRK